MINPAVFEEKIQRAQDCLRNLALKYDGEAIGEIEVVGLGFSQRLVIHKLKIDAVLGVNETEWSRELDHLEAIAERRRKFLTDQAKRLCRRCGLPIGMDGTSVHCKECAKHARNVVRESRERKHKPGPRPKRKYTYGLKKKLQAEAEQKKDA